MFTQSLWNDHSKTTQFQKLDKNLEVDVAVVGGGITGVTTALLLKSHGFRVAILEAREVGRGTSAHSTGNLYAITDQLFSPLHTKYNDEVVKQVLKGRRYAVDFIEEKIKQYDIDCDFKRQSHFVFEDDKSDKLNKEKEIADGIGLEYSSMEKPNFPFGFEKGMEIKGQAQFNPLLYIQGLAKNAVDENLQIFENTKVLEINSNDNEGGGFDLKTTGGRVKARYVVQATHTPKGVELQYHTVLGPYREYGIAAKLDTGNYPEGIYWGYYNGDKFSFRSYTRGEEQYLICVGRPHKVGQAKDNVEHIKELVKFAEQNFPIKEITHKWGGQNYKPADLLPYIGRKTEDSNEFIASGFATDGLVFGTLSALIISDTIAGKDNEFADLYKASRHNPGKAANKFVKENFDVAAQLVKDWLSKGNDEELKNIPPGDAKVVTKDGKKVAVYRTAAGEYKAFSAVCTHMGCIVSWNNAEKSWDCPCHGTRFDVEGEVLEGPAMEALENLNTKI